MVSRITWLCGILLVSFGFALASTTQVWRQDTTEEFEQGTPTGITITSDGYLQLAPQLDKLVETTDAYFWSLAEDSKGRLFIGSGNDGKVYVYDNGQGRVFFDAPEMEVHALAVDGQGNLFVGTSPDGKIYRVTPDGNSKVYYEPGAKYIWALALDGRGNLYAGTGEEGKIFRVDPQGRGEVFFDSEEKHIRSLGVDRQGNLIAGGESRARIFRLTPAGRPSILYDAPVREITSIVLASDGSIYAAGIGQAEGGPQAPASRPATSMPAFSSVITVTAGDTVASAVQDATKDLGVGGSTGKAPTPGSVIYRIAPDGYPQEIWRSDKATVFSMALQPDGALLAGTGDRGIIYRIEPDGVHSSMLTRSDPSQVTALLRSARRPIVYAITSNLSNLFALKSEYVREGTFLSPVKDSTTFSKWGRISWRLQTPQGASARLFTRSGNTQEPDNTWSDWAEVVTNSNGQMVPSPEARFILWKLVLASTNGAQTPVADSVEMAYLPRNVAPRIESVQLQPPDVAFENVPSYGIVQTFSSVGNTSAGGSASSQAQTNRVRRVQTQASSQAPPRQTVKEGYRTITWQARDANDDDLVYSVYIRGEGETTWKRLKDNIEDTFYSWDTTELPDGNYTVRIMASDARSNPPEMALTSERLTEWFEVDNTPPRIEGLTATVEPGGKVRVRFTARDSATPISEADYLIDNVEPRLVLSTDGILDTEQETFDFVINSMQSGEHTMTVRVRDGADNLASAKAVVKLD
ncbi:MAG: hypothetical protein HY314_04180 [Acidobacteria bacterium]|nr:hypothetical protein [Acidobacteriota bacterium]